jgi:cytochrome o ubiquinol oxidase operon protein cyoD
LIGLAIVQAIVQAILFLHVGQEDKPRWETISFCFMVMCVLIIVIGSLWIMHDLDERVMADMNMEMTHD